MRQFKLMNSMIVLLGLILILSVQVEAQNFGHGFGPGPKDNRGGPGEPGFGHREKNFENLMLLKMLETLDLNEDQSDQFILAFSQFRKDMRERSQATQAEVDNLIELLNAEKPDENLIKKSIDRVNELRMGRVEVMQSLHNRVAKFLTVEQLGKMTVFEERFERNLLETIQGFRGRGDTDTPSSEDGK